MTKSSLLAITFIMPIKHLEEVGFYFPSTQSLPSPSNLEALLVQVFIKDPIILCHIYSPSNAIYWQQSLATTGISRLVVLSI